MTETSPVSTQTRVDDSIERRVATVGRVGPHIEVKVIDPAKSADQLITIGRGDRLVGIVFRITALAGSPQGEDANLDATVVGSDGQAYKAVFDRIVGYANFEVGVIHAAQGETVIGAVTFQLPQYVKVVQVRWAASDGLGSTVTWSGGS